MIRRPHSPSHSHSPYHSYSHSHSHSHSHPPTNTTAPMDASQPRASASASTRSSPQSEEGETSRWACLICRARKVKCDRLLPNCTGCSKNPDGCRYGTGRKRVARRSTYKDMVERLAKMESVVKEFSRAKASTPPCHSHFDTDPHPHTTKKAEAVASPGRTPRLVFEEDQLVNAPASPPPISMNGSSITSMAKFEPHLNHTASPVECELEVEYTGSFCIFSPQGIRWVHDLAGDDYFGRVVSTLTLSPPRQTRGNLGLTSLHPLPTRNVMIDCINDYFTVMNRDIPLFYEQEIFDGIEKYYSTEILPSRSWFIAVNVILAHAFRKCSGDGNSVEGEKYIANAMSAMISMSLYFIFLAENQASIMILGLAIRLIVLGGYYTSARRPGQTDQQKLCERRLFWQAFALDHDLALRIGKPPIVGPDFIIDLPDETPEDGAGMLTFENGTTLNFLREQVILARIKSKVYSLLYSKAASKKRVHEEVKIISDLDSELCAWKARIPEITRSNGGQHDRRDPGLIGLTVLHYMYYQLIIAIHSFIFQFSNLGELDEDFDRILSSVTLCVGAARATISLLNFHEDRHPFTIHLLNNVSWSLDIVFINILQNKGTIGAEEDLNLLGRIISQFKKYDSHYMDAVAFRTANVFYQVAYRALQNHAFSQNPAPNNIPPSNTWNRYVQLNTIPKYTAPSTAIPECGPTQVRTYPQTAAAANTMQVFPADQQMAANFNLPTDEQFLGLRLNDPLPVNGNGNWNGNICTSQEQTELDGGWRLSLGLDPQYWQGLWTTNLPVQDEWM